MKELKNRRGRSKDAAIDHGAQRVRRIALCSTEIPHIVSITDMTAVPSRVHEEEEIELESVQQVTETIIAEKESMRRIVKLLDVFSEKKGTSLDPLRVQRGLAEKPKSVWGGGGSSRGKSSTRTVGVLLPGRRTEKKKKMEQGGNCKEG